jgi:hypothetical protein
MRERFLTDRTLGSEAPVGVLGIVSTLARRRFDDSALPLLQDLPAAGQGLAHPVHALVLQSNA